MKQKLINLIYNNLKYFVNDGTAFNYGNLYPFTNVYISKKAHLFIGKDTNISSYTTIRVNKYIEIGEDVEIAPCCFIEDGQYNYKFKGAGRKSNIIKQECIIKQGSWIGFSSTIIGSVIGKNSVIGSNSVLINFNVPDNHIFKGDSRLGYELKKIKFKNGRS